MTGNQHQQQGACSPLTRCPCVQLKLKAAGMEPQPLQKGQKSGSGLEDGTSEAMPLKMSLKTRSFSRDLTMSSDLAAEDMGIATTSLPRPGIPSPPRLPKR